MSKRRRTSKHRRQPTKDSQIPKLMSAKTLCFVLIVTFFLSTFGTLVRVSESMPGNVYRIKETVGWQTIMYHHRKFMHMTSTFMDSLEHRDPVKEQSTATNVKKKIIRFEPIVQPAASVARNIISRYPDYSSLKVNTNDVHGIANASNSHIKITNSRICIDDNITVRIELRNGLDERMVTGGDFLRIWMKDDHSHSSVAGYVIDHMNGTYTGVVRAAWKGRATVKVSVGHTKEQVALYAQYFNKYGAFKYTNATFFSVHPNVKESTQCSSTHWQVEQRYRGYCNFTEKNYNISYFCGQPRYFDCEDWKQYGWDDVMYLDRREIHIMKAFSHALIDAIPIEIQAKRFPIPYPRLPCHLLEKHYTWTASVPVGYRHMGLWHSTQCSNHIARRTKAYINCLAARSTIFVGDSTTRQWFKHLVKILGIDLENQAFAKNDSRGWQKHIRAKSKRYAIKMEWMPHEHPFAGTPGSAISNLKSVQYRLDRIGANRTDIVVIHWFLHIARSCDHNAFREHVRKAKSAIVRLLERSPNVQIFIKGTHSHTYKNEYMPLEYIRRFVEQVLYEEFINLQNKVTYLEGWELTEAMENDNVHPSFHIVDQMVHNFMAFACKDIDGD
ncbi:NXPE family member 1-like [Mizuhopecten yessoensis]|uniref:NXPE family member 4 n=1 Tax=Mizuhopecten yessoensis TaxID=6573 RepID=A0A210QYG2_MIZYE|nr:NXPE family member 1-like [Mizuhopecten yessoensis]OWF53766.1 NXPE family member 4 [Mizuhopecten yessoensis]